MRKALGVSICLVLLVGCGAGGTETKTTKYVRVGSEKIVIPSDTGEGPFSVTKAILAKTGYESWYQHCILGQIEKEITPSRATAILKEPEPRRSQDEEALFAEAAPACEGGNRNVIDPRATHSELNLIRISSAKAYVAEVEREGLSPKLGHCIKDQVERMSDGNLIALANSSGKVQEAAVEELVKPCVAK